MFTNGLAFLLGASLTGYWQNLPAYPWLLGTGGAGLLLLSLGVIGHKPVLNCLACLMVGWAWLFINVYPVMQSPLPDAWLGKTVIVTGKIDSVPLELPEQARFIFLMDSIHLKSPQKTIHLKKRLLLNWYFPAEHIKLEYGTHWQLAVRLKPGRGSANPGSVDFEKTLITKHSRYVGYVVNIQDNHRLSIVNPFTKLIHWRQNLAERIKETLTNSQSSALLLAMLIGERAQLSPETWKVLQATGTSHLMAISGLHVGMVAAFMGFIISHLWRFSARACLMIPAPIAGWIAALLLAGLYSLFSGFALPTQRAMIMLLVMVLGIISRRRFMTAQALSLALWCLLLWDPLTVLTTGFWLSFGAVAAIMYGTAYRKPVSFYWRVIRTQWAVTLLLAPLTLWFFSQVSLIGLLANSIAIPWVGFIVLPLAFIGLGLLSILPGIGESCLYLSRALLETLFEGLTWLSHLNGAQWFHPLTTVVVLITAIIGMMILLAPRGFPLRFVGIFFCFPVFYLPFSTPPPYGLMELTLLDVGQGLASVIRTQHHVLVYDTGPRYSPVNDAANSIVIPFLRHHGLNHISRIMISHSDMDHSGGLESLVQALPIGDIFSSDPAQLKTSSNPCYAGEAWMWDGVYFEILSPDKSSLIAKSRHDNDNSCVLKVSSKAGSILLTGDIEKNREWYLVQTIPDKLKSDVLIVPHHGSQTSSTAAFIEAVSPTIALFSAGYRNRFGFPKSKVLARYQDRGIDTYLSYDCGALRLRFEEDGTIAPQCFRALNRRFWTH
ncbi:MAG: internalization-related competence protein ComEC/Rec2 [Gammaproteobacteria bacterium]|jgi:competence protein ComEC|nr:internalization-related competence protein ComEC/Rec2 [Gammaproteobacteria bacterium]